MILPAIWAIRGLKRENPNLHQLNTSLAVTSKWPGWIDRQPYRTQVSAYWKHQRPKTMSLWDFRDPGQSRSHKQCWNARGIWNGTGLQYITLGWMCTPQNGGAKLLNDTDIGDFCCSVSNCTSWTRLLRAQVAAAVWIASFQHHALVFLPLSK